MHIKLKNRFLYENNFFGFYDGQIHYIFMLNDHFFYKLFIEFHVGFIILYLLKKQFKGKDDKRKEIMELI